MNLNLTQSEENDEEAIKEELRQEMEESNEAKSGANWFFWIAALSVINSLVIFFEGSFGFIVGLAVTAIVDALAFSLANETGSSIFSVFGLVVSILVAAVFAGFGYFARQGASWAFIAGIVLYSLDGVLYLVLGDLLAAGFHGFALIWIVKGFVASRNLTNEAA